MRVIYRGYADRLVLREEGKTIHRGDTVTLSQERVYGLLKAGHRFTEVDDPGQAIEPPDDDIDDGNVASTNLDVS